MVILDELSKAKPSGPDPEQMKNFAKEVSNKLLKEVEMMLMIKVSKKEYDSFSQGIESRATTTSREV